MDPLTAFTLVLGVLGVIGGGFVIWVVPRIEARQRQKSQTSVTPAE